MSKQDVSIDFNKNIQNVPNRTIIRFLDLLAENQDYKEISERLRNELIFREKISESSIKSAILGGEEL